MPSIRERNGRFSVMWRDKDSKQHIGRRRTGSRLRQTTSRYRPTRRRFVAVASRRSLEPDPEWLAISLSQALLPVAKILASTSVRRRSCRRQRAESRND